jgi:hypothetical protein
MSLGGKGPSGTSISCQSLAVSQDRYEPSQRGRTMPISSTKVTIYILSEQSKQRWVVVANRLIGQELPE